MANSSRKDDDETGKPLVIFKKEDGKYRLQGENLKTILCRSDVKNHPVMILSIAGALREGKSFILNFIIRYLRSSQADDWLGDESSALLGFSWKGGLAANTMGILMWSEPFHIDTDDGKVAVILMDTQGLFDDQSTMDEVKTIFCMSFLLCSFQVYNVMQQIKDDMMQCFTTFLEYAKMAEAPGKHQLLLQRLLFLIRDWRNEAQHGYGTSGGEKYIQEYLNSNASFGSASSRSNLKNAAEKIHCFLLPTPGRRVCETRKNQAPFVGALKDIDKNFLTTLPELMETFFCSENIVPKTLNGQVMTGKDVMAYAKCLDELFSKDKLPKAEDITTTIKLAFYGALKEEFLKRFRKEMDEVFEAGATDENSFLGKGKTIIENLMMEYDKKPKYEGEDKEQRQNEIYRILENELEVYAQKNRNRMNDTREKLLTLAAKQCESNEKLLRKKFDKVCVMPRDLVQFCDDIAMTSSTTFPKAVRNSSLEDDFSLLVLKEMERVKQWMLSQNDAKLRDLEATCKRMKLECERFAEEEMQKVLRSSVFSDHDVPRYKKDIMLSTSMHWDTLARDEEGPAEIIDKQKRSLQDRMEFILFSFAEKNKQNKESFDKEASQELATMLEEYKSLMAKKMGRTSHERRDVEKFHAKSCDVVARSLKIRPLNSYTKQKATKMWDQQVPNVLEEILQQNSVNEKLERQRCETIKTDCIKKAKSLLEEECRLRFFTAYEINDRIFRIGKTVIRKYSNDCRTISNRPSIFGKPKDDLEYYLNHEFMEQARERNQRNAIFMDEEIEALSHEMKTECGRIFTERLDGNETDLNKAKEVEEYVRKSFVHMLSKCSLSAKNCCLDVVEDMIESELTKYKTRRKQLKDQKEESIKYLIAKCLNTYRRRMRQYMLESKVECCHAEAFNEVEKILHRSLYSMDYKIRLKVQMGIKEAKEEFLETERLKEKKVESAKQQLKKLFKSTMENKLHGTSRSESILARSEREVLEEVETHRKRLNVELGMSIKQLVEPEMREFRQKSETGNSRLTYRKWRFDTS